MRTARRIRSLKIAVVAGVGVASMLTPLPAHATTLTITELACHRNHMGMQCEGAVSGGTGVYTFTWSRTAQSRYDWSNGSIINVYCEGSNSIVFTVTDSSNATRSQTAWGNCAGPIE